MCDASGPPETRNVDCLGWLCPDCHAVDSMSIAEAHEEARRLSEGLRELGYVEADITAWWNHQILAELGEHTPREAWLAGHYAAVCWMADCL
ncbi:MAG: hypothetical protein ACLPVF_11915 [Acidimicrobiales bacterium]